MPTPLDRVLASLDQRRQARSEARKALHLLADTLQSAVAERAPGRRGR
jgi:hypothetical protein